MNYEALSPEVKAASTAFFEVDERLKLEIVKTWLGLVYEGPNAQDAAKTVASLRTAAKLLGDAIDNLKAYLAATAVSDQRSSA
jgi:hypothetical protein